MRTPYTEGNEPLTTKRKPLRGNKKPFILFTKHEEQKQWFHCGTPGHRGLRLIKIDKGFLCPEGCGFTTPAIGLWTLGKAKEEDQKAITIH